MSPTDRERLDRLDRMGQLLRSLVSSATPLRIPEGIKVPIEGSIAATQDREWRAEHEDPLDRMITEALASGFRLLVAAEDRILTISDVARRPERCFSALTLARAAIEAVAHAFWLLDPSIDGDSRAARAAHGLRDAAGAAHSFGNKTGLGFGEQAEQALQNLFEIAQEIGPVARPKWEALARTLAAELGLGAHLSDSGFGVLVEAAHSGKNVRDSIAPDWTSEGIVAFSPHAITEWALWFLGNLYAAAMLRAGEFVGWPGLDNWLAQVVETLEGVQGLFNEVKMQHEEIEQEEG